MNPNVAFTMFLTCTALTVLVFVFSMFNRIAQSIPATFPVQ